MALLPTVQLAIQTTIVNFQDQTAYAIVDTYPLIVVFHVSHVVDSMMVV
jgi:hypothetical protein